MKLRYKILMAIFLFFLILILSKYVNAESVYVGDTIEITPREIYDITEVETTNERVKVTRKGEDEGERSRY